MLTSYYVPLFLTEMLTLHQALLNVLIIPWIFMSSIVPHHV